MKPHHRYLPLFFLCWAFLYSPLAVLSVWPVGGNAPKPKARQASQHTAGEKPVPDDFSCFCTVYGKAAWGLNCNVNFMAPFYLTNGAEAGYEVN
ncbi:hypothetical protein [Pedobacter sp.]|uniref:hypothetical protein n=1 Tax=Pedobacter sp. TaxID=1411316 RepID=UPI0031D3A63B